MYLLQSCHPKEYDRKLKEIAPVVNTDPESALSLLAEIDFKSVSSERDRAYYGLIHTCAMHNLKIFDRDTFMTVAENYYSEKGLDKEKCQIFYCIGNYYYSIDSFSIATEYYSKSELYATRVGDEYMITATNNALANCYSFQFDYEDALERYTKAAEMLCKIGNYKQYLVPKGQEIDLLQILGRQEEALSAIYEALSIAKSLNDTSSILKISGNEVMAMTKLNNLSAEDALDKLNSVYKEYNYGEIPSGHYGLVGYSISTFI